MKKPPLSRGFRSLSRVCPHRCWSAPVDVPARAVDAPGPIRTPEGDRREDAVPVELLERRTAVPTRTAKSSITPSGNRSPPKAGDEKVWGRPRRGARPGLSQTS